MKTANYMFVSRTVCFSHDYTTIVDNLVVESSLIIWIIVNFEKKLSSSDFSKREN
jgi:hypothetical protein